MDLSGRLKVKGFRLRKFRKRKFRRVVECVMSPINRFCVFVLKLYKKYLSKGLNSGCIFTPTCSVYAMEAFEKYGFFKAFSLVLSRILRCNSLNPGGYDPPDDPEVKKWLY